MGVTVGDAVERAFLPVLAPLGYELGMRTATAATFESPRAVVIAGYDPKDGELAVSIEPKDGGEHIQLLLYLRAIDSGAASKLGYAVAETEEDACKHVALFAAGLRDAEPLLRADEVAVRWARERRWWNSEPPANLT